MKKLALLVVLFVLTQAHFDKLCNSYAFNKGAVLTLQGVFCERTVQGSSDVPYLPIEGARRQFEYQKPVSPPLNWQDV